MVWRKVCVVGVAQVCVVLPALQQQSRRKSCHNAAYNELIHNWVPPPEYWLAGGAL